jgi:drug/metabolite transporter (DMT)-like permease
VRSALGIAFAVAASVANAFAIVLQAGEDRRAPLSQGGRLALLRGLTHRPRWVAGTALMVLAWPLQIVSLTFAPITVVQPLLSTTQLVLLGVARVKLHERVGVNELLGSLAIVVGVAVVVWAAPRHTVQDPQALRVAQPLLVVGVLAVIAYLVGRMRPRLPMALVIGAGLAYAWVDFANKLLADDLSSGHALYAVLWLAATVAFGALAFLEETSALQRRPAVTVAPVVGAVHDPLPVLMALWAGVELWGSAPHRIAPLIVGLAVIAAGAAMLGRSKAVARISGEPAGSRVRLAACGPDGRRPPQHGPLRAPPAAASEALPADG